MNVISKQLQDQRLAKVVKLAGPRYEQEVNIELPVRSIFHALIKSEKFTNDLTAMAYKLAETAQYTGREPFYELGKDSYDQIRVHKAYIIERLKGIVTGKAEDGIRGQSIVLRLAELRELAHKLIAVLEQAEEEKTIKVDPQGHTSIKGEINQLYDLIHQTYDIISFFESDDFVVFNRKSLLLKGEAGIGKTHLFCDFAKEAFKLGHLTYIFLGEEFARDTDPLRRIAVLLESNINYASTLRKINDEAGKRNKRAIILVDAINEAQVKVDWSRLNELKQYRNICFAVSVRTGYERVVLTTKFLGGIKIHTHPGLDIGRIEDIATFFNHFKVPMPDVPLIATEFRNPLFVKIFCKTYSRKKTVRGDMGSTTLFEDYIRRQTRYVRRAAKLPATAQLWDGLVKPIAEWMGENGTDRILENKAKELIESAFPGKSNDVLAEMQRHWLLTKTPHYTKTGAIRGYEFKFPYQKFSDHLIVRYLIKHHLNRSKPELSFLPDKKLGRIVDSRTPYYNPHYGLVEALAVQIPEYLKGRELADIAPDKFKDSEVAAETFLNSLMWRSLEVKDGKLKHFREPDVLNLVNYYMRSKALSDGFNRVLETVLNTACIENHPLDAFLLHSYLSKFDMPRRDTFWQKFVHYRYGGDGTIVDRYLHWAASPLARKAKSKVSIELTAIVLAWFLASADRRVRDKSTKALVNLLDGRYSIIIKLLKRFNAIDDVYIIERLYAVAYGCALRESQPRNLKSLATYIYNTEFAEGRPRVHILIRDYAKGIVELYHRNDPAATFDKKLYLPPYDTPLPSRIISEKTLEKHYPHSKNDDESYGSIRFSVDGMGDFGRYVIESNLHRFTNVKLDGSFSLSEQDKLDLILQSLTQDQRNQVDKAKGGPLKPLLVRFIGEPGGTPDFLKDIDAEKFDKELQECWRSLRGSLNHLSAQQIALLKKYIDGKHLRDNSQFDAKRGARWIFRRVIKLGWDPKLHGEYDRSLQRWSYGREASKPERIGKKYQWQALHEFLAIVADNYKLSKDEGATYEGTWQLHVRDIDPSCMVTKTVENQKKTTWWSNISYENWRPDLPDRQWVRIDNDLPDFKKLIKCKDRTGKIWLNLETYFGSEQQMPHVPKEKRYNYKHREIWTMLKSYVIKKDDLSRFMEWVKDKNFEGRWMPESNEFYGIFYREYPYQPAFKHLYAPYYGRLDWHKRTKDTPFDLMVTDDEYLKESSGYDMSGEGGFSIKLPSKALYTDMDLRASARDGSYKGNSRETIFFDPHIYQGGTSTLLGSLTHLAAYLDLKNYVLIWTILGEKQSIGGHMGRDKDWAGRLEFSGAYYLDNKTLDIKGGLHLKYLNTRD
jgi:hypothetical protein